MLLIPEEDVVEIDWDLNDTLQAIVSGGISMPDTVRYNRPKVSATNEKDVKESDGI